MSDPVTSLREFLSWSPTPYLVCSEGSILQANDAAGVLFGADLSQPLCGRRFEELIHGDTQQIQRFLDTCRDVEARGEESLILKTSMLGAEERVRFVELHATHVTFDGKSACLIACIDQTSARQAMLRLEQSERRFRDVAEGAGAYVWEVDTRGCFTYLSDKAEEVLGRKIEHLLGRNPFDFLLGEEAGEVRGYSELLVRECEPFREFEHRMVRGDGSVIWITVSGVPHFDAHGNWIGYRGTTIDVTHRHEYQQAILREKEKAQAADRAKSEFLAVMSHEIRTPLNSVLGFSELLGNTGLDERQREFVQTIRYSGDALLALVNDILDYSKVEAGKLEFEKGQIDLRHFCEEILRMNALSASAKGLELYCTIASGVPRAVTTDPTRFRQVLLNLVSNAVKFTHAGEVEVAVDVPSKHSAKSGGTIRLRVTVRDTGIGIDSRQREKLFYPFSQADSSTTRRFGGTGLGLAISRGLAAFLGGELDVLESSSKGSVFYFDFPVEPIEADGKRRILKDRRCVVVGTHTGVRKAMASGLTEYGAEVSEIPEWNADAPDADVLIFTTHSPRVERAAAEHPVIVALDNSPSRGIRPPSDGIHHVRKPVLTSELVEAVAAATGLAFHHHGPQILNHDALSAKTPGILVVEDNEVNRRLVVHMLRRLGYSCDAVGSGEECLRRLSHCSYALVLMDVQMPEMSGMETARRIRKLEAAGPEPKHVRIVALTAAAMEGDRQKCLEAGMDDYLSKPIRLEKLKQALTDAGLAVQPRQDARAPR